MNFELLLGNGAFERLWMPAYAPEALQTKEAFAAAVRDTTDALWQVMACVSAATAYARRNNARSKCRWIP